VDGLILVDKPAGRTSHDIVAQVRRDVVGRERSRKGQGKVRVGHAGTLDPFATGLLIVLLGRATRVQAHVMALRKTYEATARFGATSTTQDPEGEITDTGRVPAWVALAPGEEPPGTLPTGVVHQRPPAYSAVHVDGRRSYALARAGTAVELPPREVHVGRFERTGATDFVIECGSGTYVRTLLADLGDAYCAALRRTAVGPFSVAEATTTPTAADVIPLGDALARFLPARDLAGAEAERAGHGLAVAGDADAPVVLLRDADGPIALAEPRGDGTVKPVVGFR
jgi:tRNA pseudouridine55 synthase